jgi:hypothetical protein
MIKRSFDLFDGEYFKGAGAVLGCNSPITMDERLYRSAQEFFA